MHLLGMFRLDFLIDRAKTDSLLVCSRRCGVGRHILWIGRFDVCVRWEPFYPWELSASIPIPGPFR